MPEERNSKNKASAPKAKPRIALPIEDRWRRKGIETLLTEESFAVEGGQPEVVITDAPRPWRDIRETMLRLRTRHPAAEILVFVPELRYEYVEPCLRAGATGVLHFNSEPALILRAIESVHQGNIWAPRSLMARAIRGLSERPLKSTIGEIRFTRAERQILAAIRDELTNKEIAGLLQLSEATVKFHVSRLLLKTHTASRHQLRRLANDLTP